MIQLVQSGSVRKWKQSKKVFWGSRTVWFLSYCDCVVWFLLRFIYEEMKKSSFMFSYFVRSGSSGVENYG